MIELKHYRFWVQSVLPLVYDDSLSYYEVLAKCVDYINNLINNDNEMLASMEEMQGAIEELRQMIEDAGIADVNELKEKVRVLEGKTEELESKTEDLPNYETNNPVMDGTANAGISTKYSRGDHVHPTDASRASVESVKSVKNKVSSKNIADNWYFVGGTFPINQKGDTIFDNSGRIMFDRWILSGNASPVAKLTNDGVNISRSAAGDTTIAQVISNSLSNLLAGKKVTISVLYSGLTGGSLIAVLMNANGTSSYTIRAETTEASGLLTATGVLPNDLSNGLSLRIVKRGAGDAIVKAVKLEIGDTQTLAHQENNEWLVNELPNFTEELMKCQRYLVKFIAVLQPLSMYDTNTLNFYVALPMELVGDPTLQGSAPVVKARNNVAVDGFTFNVYKREPNYVRIAATKQNHGLTDACIDLNGVILSVE